jgi:hypothetical protein
LVVLQRLFSAAQPGRYATMKPWVSQQDSTVLFPIRRHFWTALSTHLEQKMSQLVYFEPTIDEIQFGFYPTIRVVNAIYSFIAEVVTGALSQESLQKCVAYSLRQSFLD